jgi:hypothetical protein
VAAILAGGTFHNAILFGSHGRGSFSRGTGLCPTSFTCSTIISTPVVTLCLLGSSLASPYRAPVVFSSLSLSARLSGHTAFFSVDTKTIIVGVNWLGRATKCSSPCSAESLENERENILPQTFQWRCVQNVCYLKFLI